MIRPGGKALGHSGQPDAAGVMAVVVQAGKVVTTVIAGVER